MKSDLFEALEALETLRARYLDEEWQRKQSKSGSILPAGGDNQTGVAVRDAHAPRFRHGYRMLERMPR